MASTGTVTGREVVGGGGEKECDVTKNSRDEGSCLSLGTIQS